MAIQNQTSQSSSANTMDREGRLLQCYKHANHLFTREKNYEYAHALFAECVLADPGNLQFVEAMVRNLRARAPEHKKSLFTLHRGGSRPLTKALQHKAWPDVLRTGIELLKANPWDVTTLHAMAEASAALHHNEVELVYLRQALDAEPKDVEVNRHCAESLGRMGQFDQAIACWHRVEKLKGKNEEATRMISFLAEEKLRYPGGRPPIVQARAAQGTKPEQEPAATAHDVVLSPQQRLEQAIERDPKNAANYLELAELLLASHRFDAAERLLTRASVACGEQQALLKQLGRVRYLRAEEQRMHAEERALEQQLMNAPIRIPWLELILGTAVLALAFQLIPSVGTVVWNTVDFRQWSQSGWIVFNFAVLSGLVALRFKPQLRDFAQRRRIRRMHRSLRAHR